MNETHQLASAMLAITFAAVMLVTAQLFIEYRASKYPLVQAVKTPRCRFEATRRHRHLTRR